MGTQRSRRAQLPPRPKEEDVSCGHDNRARNITGGKENRRNQTGDQRSGGYDSYSWTTVCASNLSSADDAKRRHDRLRRPARRTLARARACSPDLLISCEILLSS